MSNEELFSEKEVAEIVKQAAELQERSAAGGPPYSPGVSRDELERVAKEMGIDLAYLDQAIQSRLESQNNSGPQFFGAKFVREIEKVIPGELPPEDFDVIMDEIGPKRKAQFTAQVGRSLNSSVSSGLGYGQLNVTSRDGRTRLRMRSIALFPGLLVFYPAFMGTAITLGALTNHHVHLPLIYVCAIVLAVLTSAWGLFGLLTRRSHKAMQDLADRVAFRISEATKGR